MLKSETKFWIKTGWNELFERFDNYGSHMWAGFGWITVFFSIWTAISCI